jgi:enoyl-CoA hydratase
MSEIQSTDELVVQVRNRVAFLTLNRPKALNALSLGMLHTMRKLFAEWATDPNIVAVVSHGSGEKAYCAGGDVRGLYGSITGKGPLVHEEFFITEYTLNYQMHRLLKATGKPYIALMDGIVMGGGMGISQGATFRIVGDRTKMAMPETKIGLFPDVGATYFLSRATDAIGMYLGLTSNVINGADAVFAKLADTYMTVEAQSKLIERLSTTKWSASPVADIVSMVNDLKSTPPESPIGAVNDAISRHFANKDSVAAIIESLRGESQEPLKAWTGKTADDLLLRSPLLMEVTKRQLEQGHKMHLADALRLELNMMYRAFECPDVVEGIRALAIDKDNQPRWQPPSLDLVDETLVASFFAPRWTATTHPLASLETQFG